MIDQISIAQYMTKKTSVLAVEIEDAPGSWSFCCSHVVFAAGR